MANDNPQKIIIALTAVLAIIGVGLIVASFGSDHWIVSHPRKISYLNETTANKTNATSAGGTKASAKVTFGLFIGKSSYNTGFGARNFPTKIKCDPSENACAFIAVGADIDLKNIIKDYKNQTNEAHESMEAFGLFDYRLYVATLVMMVFAIVWGLVTIGFSIFNVCGRPIETITGRSGLYLWNFLALVFDVTAIVIFVGLYVTQLNENIVQPKWKKQFSSKDETDLDYSFFFLVGTAAAFLFNLILLAVTKRGCSCSYTKAGEKEIDNGMILY